MHNESAAALTAEYGDVLPPGRMRTTVDVVAAAPHDPARPAYDEAVARADVAALADAAGPRGSRAVETVTPVDAARGAWIEDGIRTANCPACHLYREGGGIDHAEAMAAFERAHPEGSHRRRARSAPPEWRLLLSSPGAWSQ